MATKHKPGDKVDVPGWGKGEVYGIVGPDGRYRVRLEDGTTVGVGGEPPSTGNPKTDQAIQGMVEQAMESRGLRRDPYFPGYAAVGPGDNNAGDPLFTGPRDQPLKEQPLDDTTAAPGETPVDVAEEVADEQAKAEKRGLTPDQKAVERIRTQDKAMRGPRE
jgi:hypothetical protein